ncbi:unnamed protein product [Polarella glacialis]|uniref:Uncharacterized protein n=1 Tax=Polarella glacialis TaxID=89957 RepID=A0A813G4I5_POLGL|nr:unnamed protein product [Polarella glacialis]
MGLQLKTLTDLVYFQTEQTAMLNRQLQEQRSIINATVQAVQSLQVEVDLLRRDQPQSRNQGDDGSAGSGTVMTSQLGCATQASVSQWDGVVLGHRKFASAAESVVSSVSVDQELEPTIPLLSGRPLVAAAFVRSPPGLAIQQPQLQLSRQTSPVSEEQSEDFTPSASGPGGDGASSLSPPPPQRPPPPQPQIAFPEQHQTPHMREYSGGKASSLLAPHPKVRTVSAEASDGFFDVVRKGSEEEAIYAIQTISTRVLNHGDGQHWTVLHIAASTGAVNVCRQILSRTDFQSIQAGDLEGNTAMHIATRHGNREICRVLLEADPMLAVLPNFAGQTPAELGAASGHADSFFNSVFQESMSRRRA